MTIKHILSIIFCFITAIFFLSSVGGNGTALAWSNCNVQCGAACRGKSKWGGYGSPYQFCTRSCEKYKRSNECAHVSVGIPSKPSVRKQPTKRPLRCKNLQTGQYYDCNNPNLQYGTKKQPTPTFVDRKPPYAECNQCLQKCQSQCYPIASGTKCWSRQDCLQKTDWAGGCGTSCGSGGR